jgi:transposase
MALGKRKPAVQADLFISATELPSPAGHPFYSKVNQVLAKHGFDPFAEDICKEFYSADNKGRPSLPPGNYFRMMMIGFFEGIDSERGIAWRVEDSLSLRTFLGLSITDSTPDHSTMSKTRRLIPVETHSEVFSWVLQVLAKEKILVGKNIGVDSTNLEANAAMRNIVRKDTKEDYQEFLTRLAKESGIETPTKEDLIRLDRKRKKKTSNKDWQSPVDPDSRIARMKDGTTHLAHKVEHAIDMDSGAVVGLTVQPADKGDTSTIHDTVKEALFGLSDASGPDGDPSLRSSILRATIADKGYHSGAVLLDLTDFGIRTYISEPARGRRNWEDNPEEQLPTYENRRRIQGLHGKELMRRRGEVVERSFAHCYETGAMRRVYLRGQENIAKRLLAHIAGFNLSLVMRKLFGKGTPRGLGDLLLAIVSSIHFVVILILQEIWELSISGDRDGNGNIPEAPWIAIP